MWVWFYGLSTLLGILYRRLWLKQLPLNKELNASRVAIDHIQSGVAWVREDGKIGSANPSLAESVSIRAASLVGHDWLELFPESERQNVQKAHAEMLLSGHSSVSTLLERADGSHAPADLRLVVIHDDKSKFLGHHCLIQDLTREWELQSQLRKLNQSLKQASHAPAAPAPSLLEK